MMKQHNKLNQNDIIGVILAGGLSSRMGHDKASIALSTDDDLDLLGKTCKLLTETGLDVWISGRENKALNLFCFPDAKKGLGPLSGIVRALELSQNRACLILSCDLPFMDQKTINALIECRNQRKQGTVLTIYVQKETGYPEHLAAIYEPESLPLLKESLEKELLKLNRIIPIDKQERIYYNSEDSLPFFNINYPADLEVARRIIRSL
ncbi:molybdenum cofactor guanylyltransferase [Desulfovibrio litoralis]|uniref:Probable molybdenum cofactor guanylyltransferase n=1 Tax=Desulfovibrio litoralis DSM 11393 TaxID=1121455 RepID=A0A1M7RVC7_9BACT|nr:molybdenum cofactor guanylyltransferase [Desulfovibrio litoralis]SHN50124.1 molybdopterin-guanine dinucleotide biosynthesis protein A [Desulfovibrio litoralis DSM 11393]